MSRVELFSLVHEIEDIREYMGISYIKAYLNQFNVECNAKVITKDEMGDVIARYKATSFPLLVGLSMYCNTQALVREFCHQIKKECPSCYILVGGPHIWGYEEELLLDCQDIDFVCTGEGEESCLDLVQRLKKNISLVGCQGISFRKDNEVYINEARPYIKDLDKLPFPYREMNVNNKKRYFYVVGSRGCLGRCTFCGEHVTGGPIVRLRSPKNIVDEIEMLINKYGYNKIHFTDATFEDPGEEGLIRAKGIFNEIIKRKLDVRMVMYTRCQLVQLFDDSYYDLAYRAGVECFFVGIESGNDADMHMYSKKANIEDNLRAIKKILNHNIYVNYGFISFNPYSTFETIRENLHFLNTSGLIFNTHHILSKLTIMPQAAIRKKMLKDGLISEFHYNSDITEYKFVHPEVQSFHKCLNDALSDHHLIDYDSQIYIDYNHLRKEMPDFYQSALKDIFEQIFDVWKQRGNYLYTFFNECINIYIDNEYSEDALRKFVTTNTINFYDSRIKQLYMKYLRELKKSGIDVKLLSLI